MSTRHALAALALLLSSCAGNGSKEKPAFTMSMEIEVAPYTEAWACWVGPLPSGDEAIAIRAIESHQTKGMHHMDLAAINFVEADIAPGMHDCEDLYRTVPALMEDAMSLYGSQQEHQRFDLPDGTAAVVPPGLQVLFEIHHVNASDVPITARVELAAYAMPMEDVEERIWGSVTRDLEISIPPLTRTTEWTRCAMNGDVDVLVLSSHTHQLGKKVTVSRFDGTTTGPEIYVNEDWHSPKIVTYMDEPLKVAAGSGFEFRCEFENPTTEEVHWGFSAVDEMCQIALVYTPGDFSLACETVESGASSEPR